MLGESKSSLSLDRHDNRANDGSAGRGNNKSDLPPYSTAYLPIIKASVYFCFPSTGWP